MAAGKSCEMVDWHALRPSLIRYLTRRTGCSSTAEDLAQDLWLRIVSVRRNSPEVRNPIAYVFRAAANIARDHARAEQRRTALNAEAMILLINGLDIVPSSEQAIVSAEEFERVAARIAALPSRTSEIFTMNRFDGIPYRKIAEELSISTTAVEKHMRRALNALIDIRET